MDLSDHFDCNVCRFSGGRYWYSRYRGIAIKVMERRTQNAMHAPDPWLSYCGYIHIDSRMCSAEIWKLLRDEDRLNEVLDHPNGGLTWFDRTTRTDQRSGDEYEHIEAGWDHGHSWDYENGPVKYNDPALVAIKALDKLADAYPDLMVWCRSDGSRHRIAEVIESRADWYAFTDVAGEPRTHGPARVIYHDEDKK